MSTTMLTKDFSLKEMQCPCCGKCEMNMPFLQKLQSFRTSWGRPLIINSGYRCAKHNTEVDGVPNSQHLVGNAADIAISPLDRYNFVRMAFDVGFKGIGIGKNFIHLDLRDGDCNLWKY